MKILTHNLKWAFMLLVSVFLISGCGDDEVAVPEKPDEPDPDPEVTITSISDLKSNYDNALIQITDDLTIEGVVVANDESGNFYKEIIIQDDVEGIRVKLNKKDLFADYPVGSKVRISAMDLYLGDYGGEIQLGSIYEEKIGQIPEDQIADHITKISDEEEVNAEVVAINDIDKSYVGKLITIENVQFVASELGRNWVDDNAEYPSNRTVEDAENNSIVVRTSNFASFKSEALPTGSGKITAVLSIYNDTYQLAVRQTSDAEMTGDRFDIDIDFGTEISLETVLMRHAGEDVDFTEAEHIVVTVTANPESVSDNIPDFIVYAQDASRGINLNINDKTNISSALKVGDKVKVALQGLTLKSFNGVMQLENVNTTQHLEPISEGNNVDPLELTIDAITNDHMSMFIKIVDVQYKNVPATFKENTNLKDCNGNEIATYTRKEASFADANVPEDNGVFLGFVSSFNKLQLVVGAPSDLNMNKERCDEDEVPPVEGDGVYDFYQIDEAGFTNMGWKVGEKIYFGSQAFEGVKFGTSSISGDISLDFIADGDVTVKVYGLAWKGAVNPFSIQIGGEIQEATFRAHDEITGSSGVRPLDYNETTDVQEFEFTGLSETNSLTITSGQKARIVIYKIEIVEKN
ncbi:DUF5689 domain-containing protein [Aureibacter tunicatorum]|uniref:DUF5689 domain-containing protein n=1 Tax=Aureibacter tunicatorum TaxID=866807 RepID=A0AAE4BV57_9BACT|nr:DUF5689 domain-containing protein [Aureibacter tunicatorum]MDR6241542.1 hypothetical protein [Aureibacter tunicatorum]BDD07234.1 hypothetical protein AUTU_47170 [Aureibacter tunicatorum]